MSVLINFKICDNAKECGGIAVCPTQALTYDETNHTIVINNDKCINCGLCRPQCPVSAIMIAKTQEEYNQYQTKIDNDPRKIKDLFVDRYGASPVTDFFMIKEDQLEEKIKGENITLIEIFENATSQCLLKSIPIRDITDGINEDILYYKLEKTDNIINKYNIKNIPSLLIFKAGKLLGRVEGYYNIEQSKELKALIHSILYQ